VPRPPSGFPHDLELWKLKNFRSSLEARKGLLASEVNARMEVLLHGDTRWLSGPAAAVPQQASQTVGGITSEEEEAELIGLNTWMGEQSLPLGTLAYDFADPATGEQRAVFDLAWPAAIQEELSQPVAVLLNEEAATLALASAAGFRCFTSPTAFRAYVEREILSLDPVAS
jgi:hypothetical protein